MRQGEILSRLSHHYAGSKSALNYATRFQLLAAVILSAQTNDNQVNRITEGLFARCPDARSLAALPVSELQEAIKTCGLYQTKAKNLSATAAICARDYGGDVPNTLEGLTALPGVGRKTANVVLVFGWGVPAFPVDTHVFRLAHRLGLSDAKTPDGVEKDLCALADPKDWGALHHALIWHGRQVCRAQKPDCPNCLLQDLCPTNQKEKS